MPSAVLGGASDPAVTNDSAGPALMAPTPLGETDLSLDSDDPEWAGLRRGALGLGEPKKASDPVWGSERAS